MSYLSSSSSSYTNTSTPTINNSSANTTNKFLSFADDVMDTTSNNKVNIIIDGANVAWELARVKARHFGEDNNTLSNTTNTMYNNTHINNNLGDDMMIIDDEENYSISSSSSIHPNPIENNLSQQQTIQQPLGPDIDGIHSMMNWWIQHHHDVICILPRSYEKRFPSLRSLYERGQILYSPPGDDLFTITTAKQLDGYIITNDKYRKEIHLIETTISELEGKRLSEYLLNYCINYTFTIDNCPLLHPIMSLKAIHAERKQGILSATEYTKQNFSTTIPSTSLPTSSTVFTQESSIDINNTYTLSSTNISSNYSYNEWKPDDDFYTNNSSMSSSSYSNNYETIPIIRREYQDIIPIKPSSSFIPDKKYSDSVTTTTMNRKNTSPTITETLLTLPSTLPITIKDYIQTLPEQSVARIIIHKYIEEIIITIDKGVQQDYTYGILSKIKQDKDIGKLSEYYGLPIIIKNKSEFLLNFLQFLISNIQIKQNRLLLSGQFISNQTFIESFVLWDEDRYSYLQKGLEILENLIK